MGASWASTPGTRKSMQANRSRDTKPELRVRQILHDSGLRYRVDYAPLPSSRRNRADIVFTRAKVAVFIDGCFWHGCPRHHSAPKANGDFWRAKLVENRTRDEQVTTRLQAAGWLVLRFWEHDAPTDIAKEIEREVRKRSKRA